MRQAFKSFVWIFASLFVFSSGVYALLHEVLGMHAVFGSMYRMFLYHYQHPFQYIAIFCAVYALGAALLVTCKPNLAGRHQLLSIALLLLVTIALASVAGGVLWKIHDMQAGYFPPGDRFWSDLWWGARNGLLAGWFVLVASVPFNLICLAGFFYVTHLAFQRAARQALPA